MSTDDGARDDCNLDIVDAHIEEEYVISLCKAYLIVARSQRPDNYAIGCPRIGIGSKICPRTIQNPDNIGSIIGKRISTAKQDIDFGILAESTGGEITTAINRKPAAGRVNRIIIGEEVEN